MKKLISLFLIASLSLTATSCTTKSSGEPNNNQNTNTNPSTNTNKEKINLDGELKGELNISFYDMMTYNEYLKEAALKFEEKYPNTKININGFSKLPEMKSTTMEDGSIVQIMTVDPEEDQQAKIDYINKVNTELVSGNAMDIYAMDVLPLYKYANSGAIENLSDYIEADKSFDISKYRENIVNAMKYKGGQYSFPIEFSFEYLGYDASLLDENAKVEMKNNKKFSYDKLIDISKKSFEIANKNTDEPIRLFEFFTEKHLFRTLFMSDYNKFVDVSNKKANFTNGKFVELLEKLKSFSDKGYVEDFVKKEQETNLNSSQDVSLSDVSFIMRKENGNKVFYKTKNLHNLVQEVYKSENTKFANFGSTSISNTENDEIAGIISNNDGEVTSDIGQSYAINSNSQNKKLAWEFIKFLASYEMQTSSSMFGRPINNEAFDIKAKGEITGEFYEDPAKKVEGEEKVLTEEESKAYGEYLNILNELSNSINTKFVHDDIIDDIVFSEIENYFNETKNAEEVSEFIQNKCELYLNE